MRHDPRTAIVAMAVALTIAACSGSSDADSTTSGTVVTASSTAPTTTGPTDTSSPTPPPASTTTVDSTTSTTVAATSTTEVATPVPIAIDDWETIIEEIDRRRLQAISDLDASDERILQACTLGAQCSEDIKQAVASYEADGLRPVYTSFIDVVEAELVAMDGDTIETSSAVVVRTLNEAKPAVVGHVVDLSGNIAYDLELRPEDTTRRNANYALVRVDDDLLPWRLAAIESLGAT